MVTKPYQMQTQTDIIRDIIARIMAAEAASQRRLDAALAKQIEGEVRSSWAGERITVAKGTREGRSERNSRIHRAYLQNTRLTEIARTEGITERRVLQIIKR